MNQNTFPAQDTDIILKIIKLIFRNIWWIIPFVVVSVGIAYVVNRYTIPSWYVSSTLLIKEDSRNRWNNNGPNFINNDLLSGTRNLQNELQILQSIPLIEQTVKNLDLEIGRAHV